ncbi:MAG TPA: asparagine synthase (glutamine-hydrolyzing) [Thermoanaerobaculia bacterium]|nr:asparagine synthase (glutamine-hydrolyzing) [Thermoanaerobaculia bacterium]
MCGIVGIASRVPVADRDVLVPMRDAVAHRGPDDEGIWWSNDGRVGFGHRRLAIIDLSPSGHQPMISTSGRTCINFNGEIYNFIQLRAELRALGRSFHTTGDTEVLLEAYEEWGAACLDHIVGMFAFAIHDSRDDTLFLARDRAGEKPLFYAIDNERLVFASELKSLMRDPRFPRRLDLAAFDHYLGFGYVPRERCILAGVHKLPQGHAARFHLRTGRFELWQYYAPPESFRGGSQSPESLVDELQDLLEKSVRAQLIAADVPVAVLLSGGVDSSLITATAARVSSQPVQTFTVTFPDAPTLDEAPFARKVATHFGTKHEELIGEAPSADDLVRLARQYDEPIADPSIIPTWLLSKAVAAHTKVALGGDGGDELFGGYTHYSNLQLEAQRRERIPRIVRRIVGAAATRLPRGTRRRKGAILLGRPFRDRVAVVGHVFDADRRARLLTRDFALVAESERAQLCPDEGTPLRQAITLDFRTYLPDDILTKVDRAAMLASLEVRAPMLDPAILEFAFGRVPDELKATTRDRKILLRMLAARLLPRDLDVTRKQGFVPPLPLWLRGTFGAQIREILAEADESLFRRAYLRELASDGDPHAHRLLAIALFELWRREYGISV